jgi:Leucine-rich repeat (LRR) protein|eukprot:gene14415-gene15247
MFIKKDRRRIDQILEDAEDSRESLLLSKRVPEFQGSTRMLLREINLPALKNLKVLNLYDNGLNSLPGIGLLSHTPVEEINLGCNKLTTLPLEVRSL